MVVRVSDLLDADVFAERVNATLEFHNFMLEHYYKQETVDPQAVIDEWLGMAERLKPMVVDTAGYLGKQHAGYRPSVRWIYNRTRNLDLDSRFDRWDPQKYPLHCPGWNQRP